MNIPAELKYTKDHEWVKVEGDIAVIGITDYAQGELGDVVYVELPETGSTFEKEESFGTIEAVKAVADIFCPLSGEFVEVNEVIQDAPETINKDPYGDGWMVKIKISDSAQLDELMDAEAYKALIG
ncbi:MAG: glycine cleavage system protein GcvH [Calditrichales bacterium]|nr:glycine cleavage system protein GcvH [Calditrichales bacterium]